MCCNNQSLGLLLLRVGLGAVFLTHGILKFQNMGETVEWFASIGLASFFAYLVALIETLGGIALILGTYVGPFGYLLAIVMLGVFVKMWDVPWVGKHEFHLLLLLGSLSVAMAGPGKYTFGPRCCKKKGGGKCCK